jgi:hypothetical protein
MWRLFETKCKTAVVVVAGLLIIACQPKPAEQAGTPSRVYFSGGEQIVTENGISYYDEGRGRFKKGGIQVQDFVFEGKNAIKLDSTDSYGLPITLTDVKVGEYFEASVWIKQPVTTATLIAGVDGRADYSINSTAINLVDSAKGWNHYFINLAIEAPIDSLSFYLFSGRAEAWFDNFEIIRYPKRPPLAVEPEKILEIYIPDSAADALASFKAEALEKKMISSDLKEFVNGYIVTAEDSIPAEIRLKGDWTDHLKNGKTSYRIKTSQSYRALENFSIQHPGTRNFMHEWFAHQLLDREGLLSTTYDFLPVNINGESQGIYALEEHFDKALLESRNRPDGPILKLDETGFWALLASGMKDSLKGSYPYYDASMITAFRDKKIEKSKRLSEQFENGALLLSLLKNNYRHPEELFDLETMAKYYALSDLLNAVHSLAWHNRRYYYNPVTARLEPIGFDMQPAILPMAKVTAERFFPMPNQPVPAEFSLDYYLFANTEFREYYMRYVNKYNSNSYLDSIFEVLEPEISEHEKMLSLEFPNHRFDRRFYYDKAEFIRQDITDTDSLWDIFLKANSASGALVIQEKKYEPLTWPFFLEEISLNIYQQESDTNKYQLHIENFHLADITITGYSVKAAETTEITLDQPLLLKAYTGKNPASIDLTVPFRVSRIYFEASNVPGEKQHKKAFNWAKPSGVHPRIELAQRFKTSHSLYFIKNDTLIISTGQHQLKELVYVPRKYPVKIEAGAEIDITQKGGLIFNNSVWMNGTATSKIRITSSDSSSQGITILNPDEVSISFAEFTNQDALNYKGWTLNGSITIYEGNTKLDHVVIRDSRGDDALNIVRGNFEIDSLTVLNTKKDALDSDYSTGKIIHSAFVNTPQDCIDSTGSSIQVSDITINNSSLEGGSAGDFNFLRIENEIKLTVPDEIVADVWEYLNNRYANENLYLKEIDSTFNSKFAEDIFTDQYFDNDNFDILKTQNGIRHRSRIVLRDAGNKKNGRQLMQLKVNHISTNQLNRGEFKYPIKYYDTVEEEWDGHPFLGNVDRKYRTDLVERLQSYGVDALALHPTILCKALRQRVYLFRGLDPFATITLDHVTAHYEGDSAHFTEIEMELNEINYTESDTAERAKMEKINDDIKADLLHEFPSIVQDQTPKYNKSANLLGMDYMPEAVDYKPRTDPSVCYYAIAAGSFLLFIVLAALTLQRQRK